ncbi:hypothetical protein HKX48_005302 [Thoreauomyces humboldtii]|nr:hypothetical protein HKX48_005302 [Thoreauomyces humboldtii]
MLTTAITHPTPGHLTEDPTPLPLSSPDYLNAALKACKWDEAISTNLASSSPLVVGPLFTYVKRSRLQTLLSHDHDHSKEGGSSDKSFKEDVETLCRDLTEETGSGTGIQFKLTRGCGSFGQVSTTTLEETGFQRKGDAGVFHLKRFTSPSHPSSPSSSSSSSSLSISFLLDRSFDFLTPVPGDPIWNDVTSLPSIVHGWSPHYTAKLPLALNYMSNVGVAVHHVARERSTGTLVAEICVFYARGVAYVQGAVTRPEFRRRGLCRRLFEGVEREARGRGYPGMVVVPGDGDERATATWVNLGFGEVVGEFETWVRPA